MYKLEETITINRPREDVFAFVADNENDTQWCYGVTETARITGDRPGINARYSFSADAGLISPRGELEIVEYRPPERLAWVGASTLTRFEGHYTLAEVAQGTELTINSTFNLKHIYRLFEGRIRKEMAAAYAEQFRALKAVLEGQAEGG